MAFITEYFLSVQFITRGMNGMKIPLAAIFLTLYITLIHAIDEVNYSTVPPDSMDPKTLPQLICLGFDDNKFYSGLTWVREMLQGKMNPRGIGNKATFDGTPVRASFYLVSHEFYILEPQPWVYDTVEFMLGDSILAVRKELYTQGHEIANHTRTHNILSPVMNLEKWTREILSCSKYSVNNMGIPPMEIYGFRTPYLDYSPTTFSVLKTLGFLYDCTLEDGSLGSNEGTSHLYPHTLHNGHIFLPALKIPGLWELAHCSFITGGGAYTTKGFDSNLWPVAANSMGVSAGQFLTILKASLDRRYNGNRAPMDIGLHSDYYAPDNTGVKFNASCDSRRKALEDFIDYALTLPDVRIVPMVNFITWMRHPAALADTSLNDSLTYSMENPSSNLVFSAVSITPSADNLGSTIVASLQDSVYRANIKLNAAMSNGAVAGYVRINLVLAKSMQNVRAMKVTYNSDFPLCISLPQDPLSTSGNSFQKQVPSSSTTTTKELVVNSFFFQKPRSCPLTLDSIKLDLSKVTSIQFSPVLLDTTMQGTVEIKELICYGAGEIGNTAILGHFHNSFSKDITIRINTAKTLHVSLPVPGIYFLKLFDVKGLVFASAEKRLIKPGICSFPLKESGAFVYFLSVTGNGIKKVIRMAVLQ